MITNYFSICSQKNTWYKATKKNITNHESMLENIFYCSTISWIFTNTKSKIHFSIIKYDYFVTIFASFKYNGDLLILKMKENLLNFLMAQSIQFLCRDEFIDFFWMMRFNGFFLIWRTLFTVFSRIWYKFQTDLTILFEEIFITRNEMKFQLKIFELVPLITKHQKGIPQEQVFSKEIPDKFLFLKNKIL